MWLCPSHPRLKAFPALVDLTATSELLMFGFGSYLVGGKEFCGAVITLLVGAGGNWTN